MPKAVGDFLILRAVRDERRQGARRGRSGDPESRRRLCPKKDGLLLCPEGGATLAAYKEALRAGDVDEEERVVLFNCATGLKYPMPAADDALDRFAPIDLGAL